MLSTAGEGKSRRRGQRHRRRPDLSGLGGYNKDLALTLSQRQPLESSSKGVTLTHLCFIK